MTIKIGPDNFRRGTICSVTGHNLFVGAKQSIKTAKLPNPGAKSMHVTK